MTDEDVTRWQAGGPVDIAITHDAPAGVAIPGITRERSVAVWGVEAIEIADAHRQRLADALVPTRPALVVHGHFHQYHQSRWDYPDGRAWVVGLDCDGVPPERNVWLVDMADLRSLVRAQRQDRR